MLQLTCVISARLEPVAKEAPPTGNPGNEAIFQLCNTAGSTWCLELSRNLHLFLDRRRKVEALDMADIAND